MSTPAMLQTTEFKQQVQRDGFAVVEQVISREEVVTLRQVLASLPLGEAVRRKGGTYGVRNLFELCPAVRELATSVAIRGLATPVLGPSCFAVRAILFDKVPTANWKLGWHQDSVIAVRRRVDMPGFVAWSEKVGVMQVQPPAEVLAGMLAIRVHLDRSHAENGSLRVLPGSHRFGWLDDEIDTWKQQVANLECHVDAGGVLAMRPLLLHASAAARNPSHRRVIHLEYASEDLPGELQWRWRI